MGNPQNNDKIAQFLLKSLSFEAIIFEDKEEDVYEIKSGYNVSKYTFPMVMQAIKTGSRADRIYLETSDVDYMYEIGPLVVQEMPKKFKKGSFKLYYMRTDNAGFYTIRDSSGDYLLPTAL